MSSYTMTLKETLETFLVFSGYDVSQMSLREMIEEGRKKLFNFEYPIFDQEYKAVFETNFIRNFFMREIGFETEDLFKFQLETWLLINMPYFNKMYESELIKFDPLVNSEMNNEWSRTKETDGSQDTTQDSTIDRTNKQNTSGTNTEDRFNRTLENDTPDSRLSITSTDGQGGVIQYASRITESDDKNQTNSNININSSSTDVGKNTGNTKTTVTDTESYLQNRTGKIGSVSYSKMLMEYRQSLLRIEKQIFDEMNKLFMLVY